MTRAGRRSMAAAAAAMVIAAATFTGAGAQSPTPPADEKVTFIFGDTAEPSSLNPMRGYNALDFYFWAYTYHLPIGFGVRDLEAVPDLVTDVETSEDGRTFTYTVRDDLTWSDGEPVTAQDLAFTLDLYKNNHAYLPQNYLRLMESVEAVDDRTVVLRSTLPTSLYSGSVPYLYTYILPEHIWDELEQPKQFANVPSVGSGPFFIAEYKRGQFVRLERNPYWEGPEPGMDEVIYRIFKNEDAQAEALKQGEIDFAYFDSASVYNSLEGEPNVGRHVGSIPSFDEIGMNTGSAFQAPEGRFEPHGDGHPALQDPTVRRAIRMAIDSQEIADKVLLGYSEPGTTIVPPVTISGARWVPTEEEAIRFDIPGANALLEEAGYRDTDGDGVREMPNGGEPLVFRYYTLTSDQNTIKTAPFVQGWLRQIGIDTEISAMSTGRMSDEQVAGTYDLFHWGWIPDPDPDSVMGYFTCAERPPDAQTYANNDSYYCNPEYDAMYIEQRTELDPERRLEIIHDMQRLYYQDAPYAVLFYLPLFQGYRTDTFSGYVPQPQPKGDLLTGYSRDAVLSIRPVGEGGVTRELRGLSGTTWLGIAGALVLLFAFLPMIRRRGAEDRP